MFGWFKAKKGVMDSELERIALENPEFTLLSALRACKGQVENQLRMGRDQEAKELLKRLVPPSIGLLGSVKSRDISFHNSLFDALVPLFFELVRTREEELANELLTTLSSSAQLRGGNAVENVEALRSKMNAMMRANSADPSELISVVYACQHCGWLNCFITEPCMKCGFIARENTAMRLAIFLSSQFVRINQLPAVGYQIACGKNLKDVLPGLDARLPKARIQNSIVDKLIHNINAKNRSSRYPNIASLAKCPNCSSAMKLSSDTVCHSCGKALQLPSLQRFAIGTARVVESIQKILAPQNTPEFGRLLCLLVMFEANAFQEGKVPTQAERTDALKTMSGLKFLSTRDGAMRVIFEPDDVKVGMNEAATTFQFNNDELTIMFDEWIAFHKHMREGISLR